MRKIQLGCDEDCSTGIKWFNHVHPICDIVSAQKRSSPALFCTPRLFVGDLAFSSYSHDNGVDNWGNLHMMVWQFI